MPMHCKNGIVRLGSDTMHYIRFGRGSKRLVILPGLRVERQRHVDLTAARQQNPQHIQLHLGEAAEGVDKEDAVFIELAVVARLEEALLVKIHRELSPMSQDTLIKVVKCMK